MLKCVCRSLFMTASNITNRFIIKICRAVCVNKIIRKTNFDRQAKSESDYVRFTITNHLHKTTITNWLEFSLSERNPLDGEAPTRLRTPWEISVCVCACLYAQVKIKQMRTHIMVDSMKAKTRCMYTPCSDRSVTQKMNWKRSSSMTRPRI